MKIGLFYLKQMKKIQDVGNLKDFFRIKKMLIIILNFLKHNAIQIYWSGNG